MKVNSLLHLYTEILIVKSWGYTDCSTASLPVFKSMILFRFMEVRSYQSWGPTADIEPYETV